MTTKQKFSPASLCLAIIILGTILGFSIGLVRAAWSEPAGPPPTANIAAPLNIGAISQYKEGGLVLGSGSPIVGFVVDGDDVARTKLAAGFTGPVAIGVDESYVKGFSNAGTPRQTEQLYVKGSIKIVDGNQQEGRVLTSDADGLGRWSAPGSSGGSSGHVAQAILFPYTSANPLKNSDGSNSGFIYNTIRGSTALASDVTTLKKICDDFGYTNGIGLNTSPNSFTSPGNNYVVFFDGSTWVKRSASGWNSFIDDNMPISCLYYPTPLTVSCSASPNPVLYANTLVTWTATPVGSVGPYTYSWSGAATGNTRSVAVTSYATGGTKTATITATSAEGITATASCSVNVMEYAPLAGTCLPTVGAVNNTARVNTDVTFDLPDLAGGNGSNSYNWNQSSFGLQVIAPPFAPNYPLVMSPVTTRTITFRFNSTGQKTGIGVTVSSAGQSITRSCPTITVTN